MQPGTHWRECLFSNPSLTVKEILAARARCRIGTSLPLRREPGLRRVLSQHDVGKAVLEVNT